MFDLVASSGSSHNHINAKNIYIYFFMYVFIYLVFFVGNKSVEFLSCEVVSNL